jgi:RNA recognition motif-containing protein
MMKSWADHSSSDEESFVDEVQEELEKLVVGDGPHEGGVDEVEEPKSETAEPPAEKVYDFPTRPPFTAFVGNLAYSVKEPEQLQDALMEAADGRLGEGKINVISGRVATDRNGRHRGFGYVEVETLDQVSTCEFLSGKNDRNIFRNPMLM